MATSIAVPKANPDCPDDHPERLLESAKCDSSLPAKSFNLVMTLVRDSV